MGSNPFLGQICPCAVNEISHVGRGDKDSQVVVIVVLIGDDLVLVMAVKFLRVFRFLSISICIFI